MAKAISQPDVIDAQGHPIGVDGEGSKVLSGDMFGVHASETGGSILCFFVGDCKVRTLFFLSPEYK